MNTSFLNTGSALTWTALGVTTVGVVATAMIFGSKPPLDGLSLFLSILAVLGGTVIVLAALFGVDVYRARAVNLRPMLLGAVAGGSIVPALAYFGNENLTKALTNTFGTRFGESWSAAISGPLTEEWLKGVCILMVLLLIGAKHCRPSHGLVVGAAVGLGFQVVEDCFYAITTGQSSLVGTLEGAAGTSLFRSLTSLASHWEYSAMVGVGLAVLLGRLNGVAPADSPRARGRLFPVGLMLAGVGLHAVWNSPLEDKIGPGMLVVKIALVVGGFLAVAVWANIQEGRYLVGLASGVGREFEPWRAMRRRVRHEKDRAHRRAERNRWRAQVRDLRSLDVWSTAADTLPEPTRQGSGQLVVEEVLV